ncbi:winged helix-turn-helix transcriptional regulator [Microbispora sp. SCL1-1]|uniref:MarR family winged helix-turn-helix transcriptional regulator n=1 Tax=unclassified Microbispora TaxID=2614687 RepID=UPI00115757A1|nr:MULTISPECIES: MarR family winged helix-turn-helix transcriptional regulator [unclassified Microbispora]NJP26923.1 winged helix-turn-helix transcriptional regulator [Microbispora sp. CL1-1]TQS11839.1 winged helix-turn-helix transcriptional regulator [Microbispora sp. SCL1-1]
MSTSDRQSADGESGPVDFWVAFKRAHEVVRARVIADTAEAAGLSEPDLTILVTLAKAGGALRQSELAASLGWDRTRVSHQLTRMSGRGLVTRERAGGVMVALTDAGRAAINSAHPGLDAAVRRHFTDKLSPQEIETLAAVFDRL